MSSAKAQQSGSLTYGHYSSWPDEERWEIIEGVAYSMTPAPSREHSLVSGELFLQLKLFFKGKPCEVHAAPFDVRLPKADEQDSEILTVVQPDLVVICDQKKLDSKGCRGAPDLVVDILSPSTASKDCIIKRALYEKHGVKELWIVRPGEATLDVFKLGNDGRFGSTTTYDAEMKLKVDLFPGLEIDMDAVFPPSIRYVKESPQNYPGKASE